MEKEMKETIAKDLQELQEVGKLDMPEVKEAVKHAASKQMQKKGEKKEEANQIAKEAIKAAVEQLEKSGAVTKRNISAAIEGAIEGIGRTSKESAKALDIELLKSRHRLDEKREEFAGIFRETLKGIEAAAASFTGETKTEIKEAVTEVKLRNIDTLGLMEETIKNSVHLILEEEKNVKESVAAIVQEAVENALESQRVSIEKVRELSKTALMSAIETAQKSGKETYATTKGAVEGIKKGIASSIEKTKAGMSEAQQQIEPLAKEELQQILKDLDAYEKSFFEVLTLAAEEVNDKAREALLSSVEEMKKSSFQIREAAEKTAEAVSSYLKEQGVEAMRTAGKRTEEAAETVKEETKVLAEKMLKIVKGAFSGMVEGTKKAMQDKDDSQK